LQQNTQEKKNEKKGESLPSSFYFALSLLALASSLPFFPFRFKHLPLAATLAFPFLVPSSTFPLLPSEFKLTRT
jgi:hypothetical protein